MSPKALSRQLNNSETAELENIGLGCFYPPLSSLPDGTSDPHPPTEISKLSDLYSRRYRRRFISIRAPNEDDKAIRSICLLPEQEKT